MWAVREAMMKYIALTFIKFPVYWLPQVFLWGTGFLVLPTTVSLGCILLLR